MNSGKKTTLPLARREKLMMLAFKLDISQRVQKIKTRFCGTPRGKIKTFLGKKQAQEIDRKILATKGERGKEKEREREERERELEEPCG